MYCRQHWQCTIDSSDSVLLTVLTVYYWQQWQCIIDSTDSVLLTVVTVHCKQHWQCTVDSTDSVLLTALLRIQLVSCSSIQPCCVKNIGHWIAELFESLQVFWVLEKSYSCLFQKVYYRWKYDYLIHNISFFTTQTAHLWATKSEHFNQWQWQWHQTV